jgi:hypothetical protein
MMTRILTCCAVVALVAGLVGCQSDPNVTGNTADISREIPKPKEGGKTFKPPGNSLMKSAGPAAVKPNLSPAEIEKLKGEQGKTGTR